MKFTTVKDYVDLLHEKYPLVSKSDIKRICDYGLRLLYLLLSYGGDVSIRGTDLWIYVGRLCHDPMDHFNYYAKKLAKKIRIMFRREQKEYDGYYYFALGDKQYEDYMSQKKRRGRPRKRFVFKNVFLYLIFDECSVAQHDKKYIFRIPYVSTFGLFKYYPELVTDKAELYMTREPLKFKDILTQYSYYETGNCD